MIQCVNKQCTIEAMMRNQVRECAFLTFSGTDYISIDTFNM